MPRTAKKSAKAEVAAENLELVASPPPPPPPPPPPKTLVPLKGDEALIASLAHRVSAEDKALPPPDPVVQLASDFVARTSEHKSLGEVKTALEALLKHQAEKGEIIQALINESYMNDVPDMLQAKDNARRVFRRLCNSSDVSIPEAIAVWKLSLEHLERTRSGVLQPGIKPVDSEQVAKTDSAKQEAEKEIARKYSKTTPQGREIIRKKLFRLKQQLKESGAKPVKCGTAPSPL